MYQLTLEKLQPGGGIVKCGSCRHIFDARSRLKVKVDGELQVYSPESRHSAAAEAEKEPEYRTYYPESVHVAKELEADSTIEDPSLLNADSDWFESEMSILDSVTVVESEFGEDWEELPLFNAISSFVHTGRTGSAMVVFSDNSMCRIYLDQGVPIAARYRKLEGKDVFRTCRKLKVLTVKFYAGKDLVNAPKSLESLLL